MPRSLANVDVDVDELAVVASAVRSSWSIETCDPVDASAWSSDNPSRGQCGTTALVLHDHFGGELLVAEVLRQDGSRQGFHYWNRLACGIEVDLTADQFAPDEAVQVPSVIERPRGIPNRCAAQYLVLRSRVLCALGELDG